MPPAATCCLLQTTRQHYRRRLIRHGNRRFLTPFCSMSTVEFSTKIWAAWISLSCGGQFWPTSPRITSASMNTGRLVPARRSRQRVPGDKIVRKPRKPQLPLFEKQSLPPAAQEFAGNGKPKGLRPGLPSPFDRAFGGPMKRYLPLLLAVISFFSARTPTPCAADEIPKTAWRRPLGQPLPNPGVRNNKTKQTSTTATGRALPSVDSAQERFRGHTGATSLGGTSRAVCTNTLRSMRTSLPCSSRWQASPREPRKCS